MQFFFSSSANKNQKLNRCNIPVGPHFRIHDWDVRKRNTRLCPHLVCTVHHLALLGIPGGVQDWSQCLHLLVWGGGRLCKWECYTAVTETWLSAFPRDISTFPYWILRCKWIYESRLNKQKDTTSNISFLRTTLSVIRLRDSIGRRLSILRYKVHLHCMMAKAKAKAKSFCDGLLGKLMCYLRSIHTVRQPLQQRQFFSWCKQWVLWQ